MGFIQLKLPKKIRRKKLPNTAKRRKALAFHETWLKIRSLDLISLKRLLSDIEFKKIHQFDWRETEHSIYDDHSQAYLPHMDKDSGVLISLNVECIK